MKTKPFIHLALVLVLLLGCSIFSRTVPPTSNSQPSNEEPGQEVSTEGWRLADPTVGLDTLDSYHQELIVSFRGTRDGVEYEWNNTHRHDVWKKASADFWMLTTSETGAAPTETLIGTVAQARYSRLETGAPCRVQWGTAAEESDDSEQPAKLLFPIAEAAEAGMETINGIASRHYTINSDESGTKASGDFWLAETGGYVVRYVLAVSGKEGEQRFEYNLSQVNASAEVVYPEGCLPVLVDFPVMEGARNLHRLPQAVDYTVSAETAAISKFYQDELVAQGWTFVNAHDQDAKNVILVFISKDQGKAASILLSAREKSVWVSAILRPWESTSGE